MFEFHIPDEVGITTRQREAADLYYDALDGSRRAQNRFAEALAFSDLPIQLQPTLVADFLEDWEKRAPVAGRYTGVETIDKVNQNVEYQDLRIAGEIPAESNGERFIGGLPKKLPEQPAPKLSFTGTNRYLRTSVRELSLDIQWETIYNTRGSRVDLIPLAFQEFADRAEDSDEASAVKLLVTATGINTGVLGTTGHVAVAAVGTAGANVTNPPLTLANTVQVISDAIAQANLFDVNGRPAVFSDFALVVAPAKAPLVRQALTGQAVTILPGSAGGVSLTQSVDLGGTIDVVPNHWLQIANPNSANYWFLVPKSGRRKNLVRVKAIGQEAPEFWIKSTGGYVYPGGGEIPALDGSFSNETYEAKTRYVVDGGVVDNAGIIYSNGTGS